MIIVAYSTYSHTMHANTETVRSCTKFSMLNLVIALRNTCVLEYTYLLPSLLLVDEWQGHTVM